MHTAPLIAKTLHLTYSCLHVQYTVCHYFSELETHPTVSLENSRMHALDHQNHKLETSNVNKRSGLQHH